MVVTVDHYWPCDRDHGVVPLPVGAHQAADARDARQQVPLQGAVGLLPGHLEALWNLRAVFGNRAQFRQIHPRHVSVVRRGGEIKDVLEGRGPY